MGVEIVGPTAIITLIHTSFTQVSSRFMVVSCFQCGNSAGQVRIYEKIDQQMNNLKLYYEFNGTISIPPAPVKNGINITLIPVINNQKPNETFVGEKVFAHEVTQDRLRLFYTSRAQLNSTLRNLVSVDILNTTS